MNHRWHISAEQLGDYLADRVDAATADSVEAHLVGCSTCRSALAERSDPALLDDSWMALEQALDGEPASRVERFARRAGFGDREIRTLAPTLSLQAAWLAAAFLALLVAAWMERRSGGQAEGFARLLFLTVAPLAPLTAVVAALSAASEAAPEVAQVTPASRLRIVAVRATTVMSAAIILGLIASAVLPGGWIEAVLWLLPALALSGLGALAGGRLAATTASAWLGSAWVVAVLVAARLTDDRLAAFRPGAQVVYLVIAVLAVAWIAVRPDSIDLRSRP
ncbi:MAG: zf-HC2 domain-containing protein [Candidatus Microthrix sp.]|nr:zf-HC2 domain-containing protein [Candidatus Microthrix sp.]MBK6503433.1 zf-HC2 domain-containing protein [Candidatus Microthrix sp.]